MWTSRVGYDARIDQLEGHGSESCLSWLRSHEGCPKHDLFPLEYSRSMRKIMNNLLINVKIILLIFTP